LRINSDDIKNAREIFKNNFRSIKTDEEIFYQLCFCICTPQTTFKNNTKVVAELKERNFYAWRFGGYDWQRDLEEILKPVRFYRNKAKWLTEAKKNFGYIIDIVGRKFTNCEKRDWLVKNIKGFGMKTASHFLRNLGAKDLAIIDTHILKYLFSKDLITSPKAKLTKYEYECVEIFLRDDAQARGMSLAEFDIVLWKKYSNTEWDKYVY
jgi:N-glycosylase/DNA lyase